MIFTMTCSFSSGVWSRGTTTSAAVRFCSSLTWGKGQRPPCHAGQEGQTPPAKPSQAPGMSPAATTLQGCPTPIQARLLAYSFAPFADDPARGRGGDPDVRLQLHFFLGSKEVLLLQLPVNPALCLRRGESTESGTSHNVPAPPVPTGSGLSLPGTDQHPMKSQFLGVSNQLSPCESDGGLIQPQTGLQISVTPLL